MTHDLSPARTGTTEPLIAGTEVPGDPFAAQAAADARTVVRVLAARARVQATRAAYHRALQELREAIG
jgi:hypothetical protein